MITELWMRLIQAAGQDDEFVHYDEVADILGISHNRLDHSYEMNHALEEISTYEHDKGRPLLTAVVVHKEDLTPGGGFFELARRLGKMMPGEDRDRFFLQELSSVRRYWLRHGRKGTRPRASRAPVAGSDTPFSPGVDFRIVFQTAMEPNCSSGRHLTEKFRTPDNARLWCAVRKRRTRLIPLNIFRSAYFEAVLRDASTDKVAKDAMKEGRGKLFVRGKSLVFGGRTVEGEMVIQHVGEYYLEISWGSLIRSWEIAVAAPRP